LGDKKEEQNWTNGKGLIPKIDSYFIKEIINQSDSVNFIHTNFVFWKKLWRNCDEIMAKSSGILENPYKNFKILD
jgi:hypothetical protein